MRNRPVTAALMLFEGAAIIAAFLYPAWLIHARFLSHQIEETPLSLAISFLMVQAAVIFLQLLASCALKWIRENRAARTLLATPDIHRELALHAAGENRLDALRRLEARYPRDFDQSMESFLSLVNGRELETLRRLARDLKLTRRWERRARYGDERHRKLAVDCLGLIGDERGTKALWRLARRSTLLVEAAACRFLARSQDRDDAIRLFQIALDKPWVVRVLLAGELRRHARALCETVLPEEFERGDEARILAALELAASWGSELRLPTWTLMMSHPSPVVRAAAMRLAAFQSDPSGIEPHIIAALQQSDTALREAALIAVCHLRTVYTLPLLALIACGANGNHARLACIALSRMQPEGVECLRTILLEGSPGAAARAAECLANPQTTAFDLEFA